MNIKLKGTKGDFIYSATDPNRALLRFDSDIQEIDTKDFSEKDLEDIKSKCEVVKKSRKTSKKES